MAVNSKPAGIPVSGNRFKTIAQALPHNLEPSACADALRIPLPVHRLDAPTTGLLVVAKTGTAMVELGRKFADREVRKCYHAVVFGTLTLSGKIDSPVDGKPAQSICTPLRTVSSLRHKSLTLVKLEPLTGRTHQLRIHMAEAGHPIVGDAQYGSEENVLKGKGLLLAATGIALRHPVFPERKINVQKGLPHKFTALLEREERRWRKFNTRTE
jgi:23S rRNA-/tRNA-specific pseudouridylate synthase